MERHRENEEVKSGEDTDKLTRKTRVRRDRGEPGAETENALGHGGVRAGAACPVHARSRPGPPGGGLGWERPASPPGRRCPRGLENGAPGWESGLLGGPLAGQHPRPHLGPHLPCVVAEGGGGLRRVAVSSLGGARSGGPLPTSSQALCREGWEGVAGVGWGRLERTQVTPGEGGPLGRHGDREPSLRGSLGAWICPLTGSPKSGGGILGTWEGGGVGCGTQGERHRVGGTDRSGGRPRGWPPPPHWPGTSMATRARFLSKHPLWASPLQSRWAGLGGKGPSAGLGRREACSHTAGQKAAGEE